MRAALALAEKHKPVFAYGQVAAGGLWEKAVRLDQWPINASDPSVAVELFYDTADNTRIFFGARYDNTLKRVSDPADFVKKIRDITSQAGDDSLTAMLRLLGQTFDDNPNCYLDAKLEYAEVGVENYWQSLGVRKIWQANEPLPTETTLRTLLNQNTNLLHNAKNHIVVELSALRPKCWIGFQVSKKAGEHHAIDFNTLNNVLAGVIK
jgi:hypothetical protein